MDIALHLTMASRARDEGNQQAAINAMAYLQDLEGDGNASFASEDEYGQVLWAQGEHALALRHLNGLIDTTRFTNKNYARLAVLLARQVSVW